MARIWFFVVPFRAEGNAHSIHAVRIMLRIPVLQTNKGDATSPTPSPGKGAMVGAGNPPVDPKLVALPMTIMVVETERLEVNELDDTSVTVAVVVSVVAAAVGAACVLMGCGVNIIGPMVVDVVVTVSRTL